MRVVEAMQTKPIRPAGIDGASREAFPFLSFFSFHVCDAVPDRIKARDAAAIQRRRALSSSQIAVKGYRGHYYLLVGY